MSSTFKHDTVTGSQSNAVVEFRVLGDGRFAQRQLCFLPLQNLFHLRNIVERNMRGGARSQRRFEHLAKIQKLADQFLPTL